MALVELSAGFIVMPKSFLSPNWYRVAEVKPKIRPHAETHRQRFRGQTWYILQDHQSGRFHRLSPAAHRMLCMMNGSRTVHEIWESQFERLLEMNDQPTQDETIHLLIQLHSSDLLDAGLLPDVRELSERAVKRTRREVLMRAVNPLAVRIPLFDPDEILERTAVFMRPIFTKAGFVAWLLVVVFGVLVAVQHWGAITTDAVAMAFSAQNVVLMMFTYIVIKATHELGHAYAAKMWGGEIHEIGIMILVLMPVPYVDASCTYAFSSKWRRAMVAGAGIMTEALLAAIAAVFWVMVESGIARTVAFNVMIIGGVSTLLFNGNPLLKFDGYYVLCDLLEIPNLGTRANKYFLYLLRRNALGMQREDSPVTARGEEKWFVVYAVCSYLYRAFIVFVIALFISTKLFFLGVALGILTLVNAFVWPICKGIHYLLTYPGVRDYRTRAFGILVSSLFFVCVILFMIPLPYSTMAQGVMQLSQNSFVYAGGNGFVREIKVVPGQLVSKGTSLIELEDVELLSRLDAQKQVLEELNARKYAADMLDRVEAKLLAEQIRHAEADVDSTKRELMELRIVSHHSGSVVVPNSADLIGRFVRKGEMLAYVMNPKRRSCTGCCGRGKRGSGTKADTSDRSSKSGRSGLDS